jgi:spermidine/putrescine transport system substrate-binding protein
MRFDISGKPAHYLVSKRNIVTKQSWRRQKVNSLISLRLLFVAVFGLILAACARVVQPAAPVEIATHTPAESEDRVLDFHNWETYIDPKILSDFEKQFNVKINYTLYSSNEQLLEDVHANPGAYDLVVPSDYMLTIMRRENLVAPLNKDNVPNMKNIDPAFLNMPFDPGNRYCVPYQWGTGGIGYNIKKTGREIKKWADLFDPAFAGRVAMLNDPRMSLAAILLYLGYSPNTTNHAEIEQARDFLISQSAQIKTYTLNAGQDLLMNGDVDLTVEWSGDIFQAMSNHPDLRYAIPEEGTIVWVDNICVMADAKHPRLGERFINYLLEPEVGATLSNFIRYASPNQASLPFINKADLNNPALYPPEATRRLMFFLADLGPDDTNFYNAAWDTVLKEHK